MGAYEVYAFWNGADVRMVLNAVAGIMGGNDFLGLMKAVALVGLISAATYALIAQRGDQLGGFLAGFVFVYAVIFVPKVDVIVNDVRAGTTNTVSNVPLGLAAPYATLSHIGYWLTTQYESQFTTLDDERFSKNGMVFGARVLETLALRNFNDPGLKSDVATFYKDCLVPELIDNPGLAKTIRDSKDIPATISTIMNPGRGSSFGTISYLGSHAMSCDQVPSAIALYIGANNLPQADMTEMGRIIHADDNVASTSAVLGTLTETNVEGMLGNMLSMSDTAVQALTQSMWINGIHDADMALRNGYGNAATTSYATAVTEQSTRQSAYTGKMWAEKALPLVRNVAEFVLIALFPMIIVIMLAAGERALMAMKLYISVLASLALWAPLTAVLNYQVIANGKTALMATLHTSQGFSLNNMSSVVDLALQQQALAGQLFITVPILAYAIVSAGAYAATTAMGGLTGAASSAGSQVSGQAALGNVGGGQVNWMNTSALNTSAGQVSTAYQQTSGFASSTNAAGTVKTGAGAPAGGYFTANNSQLPNGQMATISSALENSAGQKVSAAMGASRSSIASALESVKEGMSHGVRSENASMAAAKFSEALATSDSTKRERLAGEGAAYATKAREDATHQNAQRAEQSVSAGLGLGISGGKGSAAGGDVGAKLGFNTVQSDTTTKGLGVDSGTSSSLSNNIGSGSGSDQKTSLATESGNTNSKASFAQSAFEKASQFGLQGQAQAQQSRQASEELSAIRSDSGGIRTDLANQVVSQLGGGQAARQAYMQDPAAFNAAATKAAEGIIASRDLGPGAFTQLSGASGSAAQTSAPLSDAKSAVESKVEGEIVGAPASANSRPEAMRSAGTGQPKALSGRTPRSGGHRPSGGFQAGNAAGTPSAPQMPASVQAVDGSGSHSSEEARARYATRSGETASEVSNDQAKLMREVGRNNKKVK